jgi:hypothetical protein
MHDMTQGSSHHIFATNPQILGRWGYLVPPRRSSLDWNVEKGGILPEAAESPAPATAMICLDDDSNSRNAAMSWDALELILRILRLDCLANRGRTKRDKAYVVLCTMYYSHFICAGPSPMETTNRRSNVSVRQRLNKRLFTQF